VYRVKITAKKRKEAINAAFYQKPLQKNVRVAKTSLEITALSSLWY
jgi:hypothetical protein